LEWKQNTNIGDRYAHTYTYRHDHINPCFLLIFVKETITFQRRQKIEKILEKLDPPQECVAHGGLAAITKVSCGVSGFPLLFTLRDRPSPGNSGLPAHAPHPSELMNCAGEFIHTTHHPRDFCDVAVGARWSWLNGGRIAHPLPCPPRLRHYYYYCCTRWMLFLITYKV